MLVLLTVVAVLLSIRILIPASTPGIRASKVRTGSKGIACLEKLEIGGSEQWILERSEDISSPILLFLHGGPGTSELTLNRRNTKGLEKHFIVVNWDQRGAGKSYKAIHDAGKMNIEQFVNDTRELTLFLLKKFNKKRLVLIGHSWGTVVGALTVSRYPELYSAYVGIGQIAKMAEGESVSYEWTLERAKESGRQRAVRALEKIGHPPYKGDWQKKTVTERRYLGRFGGEYHSSKSGAFGVVIRSLLFSREYTLPDRLNFFKGILGSMKLLWPQLLEADFFRSLTEFSVPVFLMEGRFDFEVPSIIAERYFNSIKAPSKELIWFEQSAHMPNWEEIDKFNGIIVESIRPVASERKPE